MSRVKGHTQDQIDYIYARRRAGCTLDEITGGLAQRGTPLSRTTVFKILRDMGIGIAPVPNPAALNPPPEAESTTPPGDTPKDPATTVAELVSNLASAAKDARNGESKAQYVTITRALTQALALQAKLTPEPRQDINDRPDMIRAADEARELLRNALERALAGTGPQ